jgi:hypothetical protein
MSPKGCYGFTENSIARDHYNLIKALLDPLRRKNV